MVELVQLVLQLVDVVLQSSHLGINVSLLQGGDVVDLDGGRVGRRLRAVPSADAGQELRRGLLLGQGVDVPLCLPVKAVIFGFAQDEELSEHTASMPAIMHFLQGEAKVTLGDDTLEAKPRTWIHMPTGQRHSIQAKTPVVMLLLLLK